MDRPEVQYARAFDGTYLAYQTFGRGPIDIVWQQEIFAMVDELWDSPPERAWHMGLAEFARVTTYDKRGTGLSSRNVAPGNLETQVADTLAILDDQGIDRAVLGGFIESGAANALLAATYPDRVQALVWMEPAPRTTATPDYPWGVDPEYVARDQEIVERWGTSRWAREFVELNALVMGGPWGSEEYIRFITRASRRTCTPDVAKELTRVWYDTDVRGVLPAIQAPMLLVTSESDDDLELARSVAERVPRAEIVTFPGPYLELEDFDPIHAAIRRFIGAERPPLGLDSVLATVLFTDIVGSTERRATLGDRGWQEVHEQHDRIVRNELERYRGLEIKRTGDGFLATFDGPARGVHCALTIAEEVRSLRIEIRAGLHTGEIQLDAGDIAGLTVAIGARVAALAGPSEVLVSSTVKDLVAGSGLVFEDRGEHTLKGVPDAWRLYAALAADG
jgi:class 3 adenylate cyclase